MKYNENEFADATLLKLHPIVNVFLLRLQAITLQKQGVEITFVQGCFNVVMLKEHLVKVISAPCLCKVFIWTPIPAS